MRLRVVRQHRSAYPDPVTFEPGDRLEAGRRDKQYPGWIWVTTADGREGWAPEQYLDLQQSPAVALVQYSARELDTEPGDEVERLEALNGWLLVCNARGECGWVPAHTTAPADVAP
jgi:SH3-like domain-containing protein